MTASVVGSVEVVSPSSDAPRGRRLWNDAERRAGDAVDELLPCLPPAAVGEPRRWAIVLVTSSAGEGEFRRQHDAVLAHGPGGMRPSTAPFAGLNSVASVLSIELEAIGPNMTISGGAEAFGYALVWAERQLAIDDAEVALVIAVEETAGCVAFALSASEPGRCTVSWSPARPAVATVARPSGVGTEVVLSDGAEPLSSSVVAARQVHRALVQVLAPA